MQHPYQDLPRHPEASSSINRKQAVILRSLALVKILLGCAIVGTESISKCVLYFSLCLQVGLRANLIFAALLSEQLSLRQEESTGVYYLAGMGICTGVSMATAGLFALFNSRRVYALDSFTKRVAVGHMVTSIVAAVFTMAIFMLRVMFLTVLPIEHESWRATEVLPLISTGLYTLSFIALGVSVGFSFAVFKGMKSHSRCGYSNVLTVQLTQPQETVSQDLSTKASQTAFLSDMEATVDGYYQRLHNEED